MGGKWMTGSLGLADANSYVECVNSEVILCRTGKYIPHPVLKPCKRI